MVFSTSPYLESIHSPGMPAVDFIPRWPSEDLQSRLRGKLLRRDERAGRALGLGTERLWPAGLGRRGGLGGRERWDEVSSCYHGWNRDVFHLEVLDFVAHGRWTMACRYQMAKYERLLLLPVKLMNHMIKLWYHEGIAPPTRDQTWIITKPFIMSY